MNKKDWYYVFRVVGSFAAENKKTIVCLLIAAVTGALRPFIPVVMMGALLDAIAEGAQRAILIRYVLTGLFLNLIVSVIESRARQSFNQVNEYMRELEAFGLNRKSLVMDYEYLEDIHVQELRTRGLAMGMFLGVTGWTLYCLERILSAVVSIAAAVWIIVPMFAASVRSGAAGQWIPAILLLALIAVMVWWDYRFGIRCTQQEKEAYDSAASGTNKALYYLDLLAGAETQKDLRCYSQQEAIERDADEALGKMNQAVRRVTAVSGKKSRADQTVSDLSGLLVYLFTGLQAFIGMISIGQVVTYASSILRFSRSVAELTDRMGALKKAAVYCKDQVTYQDLKKRKYEGTIPLEKRRDNKFKVSFEHVSFRYPGTDRDVIRDLNLEFVIGERMAIVGKNGSGKTTFIKLLCRLYDVTEGCIKVNGIDIRSYDYREYCRLFSVVFQDFRIFSFPLGENIAASEQVEEERAADALTRAGLNERLASLPNGLAACVGKEFSEDGVSFSGGEKQKMAIARAIYKDAPFVIMDEPTAALDPPSECEVYAGFDKMVGNKTALYISHRLASCRFCRDILVFDRGRVVQRGSHEELEKQEGLYRELWNAQAQYYRSTK